jgi:hypothetical protein
VRLGFRHLDVSLHETGRGHAGPGEDSSSTSCSGVDPVILAMSVAEEEVVRGGVATGRGGCQRTT